MYGVLVNSFAQCNRPITSACSGRRSRVWCHNPQSVSAPLKRIALGHFGQGECLARQATVKSSTDNTFSWWAECTEIWQERCPRVLPSRDPGNIGRGGLLLQRTASQGFSSALFGLVCFSLGVKWARKPYLILGSEEVVIIDINWDTRS